MQQQTTFPRVIRSTRKRVVSALNLHSFIANHFAFLMKMGTRIKDEVDHFTFSSSFFCLLTFPSISVKRSPHCNKITYVIGHEHLFMKESIKEILGILVNIFCAQVNWKQLLNIWNLLGEDKNIDMARLLSITNNVIG